MRSKVTTIILLIFCAAVLNMTAQETSLTVLVYDADTDDPIENALVTFFWNGNGIDSTYTNINGIANIDIPLTRVSETDGLPSTISLSNNYPNPFNDNTNVEMNAPVAQTVTASIYNILGQRVASEQISVSGGNNTLNISLGHLPRGVYFLRVGGRESKTIKLTKIGSDFHSAGPLFSVSPSIFSGSTALNKVTDNVYTIKAVKEEYDANEYSFSYLENTEFEIPLTNINNDPGNDDATLSDLTVDGETVDGFDPSKLEYGVVLPAGTTENPPVSAAAFDPNAEVDVSQATSLPGIATIEVTAEDGITKLTYEISFTIESNETVTDIDGNVYPTVLMGMKDENGKITYKRWLAENLRVTHYRNGDPIPTSSDNSGWENLVSNQEGAWTVYSQGDSSPTHLSVDEKLKYYGAMYTWWAVEEDIDGRGLCPAGWHVPSDDEWTQLERYLGTPEEKLDPGSGGMGNRGQAQLVGARLKSTRTGVINAYYGVSGQDPGAPDIHFRTDRPGVNGEEGVHPYWAYPNIGANPHFLNPEDPSYVPTLQVDYIGSENDYNWFLNPDNRNPLDYDIFEGGYIWNRQDMMRQGTVTSATNNTLTDDSAPFGDTDSKVPWRIHIRTGDGAGQMRVVISNTSNTIVLGVYDEQNNEYVEADWDITPSPGDEYNMYSGFLMNAQPSFAAGENFVGNETGFSLIPSGMRTPSGSYGYRQRVSYLWTSTPGRPPHWDDSDRAMVRVTGNTDPRVFYSHSNPIHTYLEARYTALGIYRGYRNRGVAISVRCLED